VHPVRSYRNYKQKSSSEIAITRMSMLHTVIFKIQGDDETTPTLLEPYLRVMPSLNRLEITMHNGFSSVSVWETLLKTSVPTLTYFNLEINALLVEDADVDVLESIQTPFWIEKKNFNIIIKKSQGLNSDPFHSDALQNSSQSESNSPVIEWWIGPRRKLNDNVSTTKKISSLNLSTNSSSLLQDHYLDNVNHLIVNEFNDNLLELITKHVNCSRIKHLDVSFLKQENNQISSLLPYIRNITSLRIRFDQVFTAQFGPLRVCNNVKFLDISANQHSFNEKHMSIIADMFPKLEHLAIDSRDLRNVPMLQTYLPRLRSLTFASIERNNFSSDNDYKQKMSDVNLRRKTQFLFQREAKWITVWIDQAALQETYWQITDTNSQWPTDDSMFDYLDD